MSRAAAGTWAAAALAMLACGRREPDDVERPGTGGPASPPPVEATAAPALPPVNGGLDYQLGGAYPPAAGVGIVVRDRRAAPAEGLYNVCYVNGFQAQPDEVEWWRREHPALLLRDAAGAEISDEEWAEPLLDVSTPARRAEVAAIVGAWIRGCKEAGFDAVEIDNLDAYLRSRARLTEADALATMTLFAARAHAEGLAIAQKNAAELAARRADLGTDFAIAEECQRYDECDVYARAYGDHVLVIEYRREDFDAACARHGDRLPIVLRDRALLPAGAPGHVFAGC